MAGELDPWTIAAYEQRRNALRQQYAQSQAQNAYSQGQAGLQYGISQRNLGTKFDTMRQRLPGGFARRGLLNSGIYGEALQNYGRDRVNTMADLGRIFEGQLGQFALSRQGQDNSLQAGLAAIQAEEDARRAQLAAMLRGIQ